MKKIMLGTIVTIFLILNFSMADFMEIPPTGSMPNPAIEKTDTPQADSITSAPDAEAVQNDSIFSASPIISLCLVVIGIVAFRQNSYI